MDSILLRKKVISKMSLWNNDFVIKTIWFRIFNRPEIMKRPEHTINSNVAQITFNIKYINIENLFKIYCVVIKLIKVKWDKIIKSYNRNPISFQNIKLINYYQTLKQVKIIYCHQSQITLKLNKYMLKINLKYKNKKCLNLLLISYCLK